MMQKIYENWMKSCLVSGLFLLVLLLSSLHSISWVDFLVWLQVVVYLFHQSEEHEYPGGFKTFIDQQLFKSNVPNMPLNDAGVFWINILAIWIAFPFFAILAQNVDPAYGLVLPIFGLFNATTHIIAAIVKQRYNPGLFVSIVLNYPTGIYTLWVMNQMNISNSHNVLWAFLFALVYHLGMVGYVVSCFKRYKKQHALPQN